MLSVLTESTSVKTRSHSSQFVELTDLLTSIEREGLMVQIDGSDVTIHRHLVALFLEPSHTFI